MWLPLSFQRPFPGPVSPSKQGSHCLTSYLNLPFGVAARRSRYGRPVPRDLGRTPELTGLHGTCPAS